MAPGILPVLMRSRTAMLCLERPAEIARAGHAGHQQLLRGGRHDHRLELRRVGLVPVVVVGVADDHRVDVHVPEAGEHGHAFGGDHLGAGGDGERADLADGGDLVAVDEDDAVLDGRAGEAVDEGAADEGFRSWRPAGPAAPRRRRREGARQRPRHKRFMAADATRTISATQVRGNRQPVDRPSTDRQSVNRQSALANRQ